MTAKISWLKPFIIFLILTFLAAYSGSMFMPGLWYEGLIKPVLTPPNQVFPIAWTILYSLMVISMTWVYVRGHERKEYKIARNLFLAQLLVNALWSWLFFGLHQPLWGLLDIVLLWILVILMIYTFARISIGAAVLQVPYLCWLSFAGWLNWGIWHLNA
ncbi:MAG: TspO/MBR family protein [Gammaproteobacteria bacterium]|jgi:tryptophan-rich sensory protein